MTPDGTKAVYETSTAYYLRNLANGTVRTWTPSADATGRSLDETGRYVWNRRPASAWAGALLIRHDLLTGTEVSYPDPVAPASTIAQSTERFVFLQTNSPLVPVDDNATSDVYAFDRYNGSLTLVTDRKGSRRAAGNVTRFDVSPNGSKTMFSSLSPGVWGGQRDANANLHFHKIGSRPSALTCRLRILRITDN